VQTDDAALEPMPCNAQAPHMRSGRAVHKVRWKMARCRMSDVRCTRGPVPVPVPVPVEPLGTALRLEEIPRVPQRIEDKLSQDLGLQVIWILLIRVDRDHSLAVGLLDVTPL